MMSIETINAMNRERAQEAAAQDLRPWVFEEEDRGQLDAVRGIPNFGDYRPEGWTVERELFVDSSGFGAPGEPALTIDQFLRELKVGMGYAIIAAGQFQVYIAEFRRDDDNQ